MRWALLLLLIALAGCSSQSPAPDRAELPLGLAFLPVADDAQRALTLAQLDALGVGHVRLGQPWGVREPERDVWRPLEDRVSDLEDAGVGVFLTLEIEGLPGGLDGIAPGEQEAEVREYVRELLGRVGTALDGAQFGNEWTTELERFAGGDVGRFVRFANVLYDEVQRLPVPDRPGVALGSFSIGGLHGLALLQGRIENVVLEGGPLYTAREVAEAEREGPADLEAFRTVVGGVRYDALDIHLYDDYWNWPAYQEAVRQLAREAEIAHPNSFLISADLRRTASFDVVRRAAGR